MTVGEFIALWAAKPAEAPKPLDTTQQARDHLAFKVEEEKLILTQDNRKLRKTIAACVGIGLAIEIIILFVFVLFQGIDHVLWTRSQFKLEKWTFSIFTSAVLLQTFGLANLIVRNLFPNETQGRLRKR